MNFLGFIEDSGVAFFIMAEYGLQNYIINYTATRKGVPMAQGYSTQDTGLKFFRLKKVVTLEELALHMQCSTRTVQRRLAKWHAISSYNRNGSSYTLPGIATFDANGLWHHRGAFFSRFGTLSETFVRLVANSQAGVTAAETGELLGVRPSSFLSAFAKHPQLSREKVHGRFVYYSSEETVCKKQREHRRLMSENTRLPTDFEAIAILIEKIKCPSLNNEELSLRLGRQKLSVAPEVIGNLFAKHGLSVKKTPHSV